MTSYEEAIEHSLKYLAKAITTRADGEKYFLIFERLEDELRSLRSKDAVKDRILRMAEAG